MAVFTVCDRCDSKDKVETTHFYQNRSSNEAIHTDLCERCNRFLVNWLKEKEPECQ